MWQYSMTCYTDVTKMFQCCNWDMTMQYNKILIKEYCLGLDKDFLVSAPVLLENVFFCIRMQTWQKTNTYREALMNTANIWMYCCSPNVWSYNIYLNRTKSPRILWSNDKSGLHISAIYFINRYTDVFSAVTQIRQYSKILIKELLFGFRRGQSGGTSSAKAVASFSTGLLKTLEYY